MFCSFCTKSAPKVAVHSLCRCCMVHLKCHEATAENLSTPDEPNKAANRKLDCEFCRKKFRKSVLGEHREKCKELLAFRCTVCDGDFVSKEGLWNHLDMHQVTDKSKGSHCKETRLASKLLQCTLCNDQRGYQESLYWRHIHEDHDGFFLRCLGCDDKFRSQTSMNEHMLGCRKALNEHTLSTTVHQTHNCADIPVKTEVPPLDDWKEENHCQQVNEVMEQTNDAEENCVENTLSASSKIKCLYCVQMFIDKKLLSDHMENCHLTQVCNVCGENFVGRTRLRYHKLTTHTEAKHKCPYCMMEFHRKNNFKRHMFKHVEEKKVSCELCGAKFKSLENLASHKKRIHRVKKQPPNSSDSKEKTSADQSSPAMVADEVEPSTTIYHCPVCDVKFDDDQLFSQHVGEVHQLTVCTICGSTFTSVDQLDEHKETYHPTITYNCSQCEQKFDKETSFQEHLVEHEKKENFLCELCDQRFEEQVTLQHHFVSAHNTVVKPDGIQCTCPICGETLPSIQMFRHHKLKFHTEPKYQCSHCPRKFHTKGNYLSHVVAHNRQRIFSCRFCSIRYKRLSLLLIHMKLRHGSEMTDADQSEQNFTLINHDVASENGPSEDVTIDTPEEKKRVEEHVEVKEEILVEETSITSADVGPVKCSHCEQLFCDENALQNHVKVRHQTAYCEICEIQLENSVRFRYHKLVVHTEPQYECSQCKQKFHLKKVLLRHERTHQKEQNSLKPIIRIRVRSKYAKPKSKSPETDQSASVQCHLCSSKFVNEDRLQRHIDALHSKAVVQCTTCDLTFPSRYQMYYHRQKTHTEARHQCPHCEKKFHVKYRLQEHLSVHLNDPDNSEEM